jgi:hypothetical protein
MTNRGKRAVGLITLALLAPLARAQELPDWVLLLSRAKRQARANFSHYPNYACKETIDRYVKRAGETFRHIDTLELEVAVVGGHEFFARKGGRFDLSKPDEISGPGMFGTGSFFTTAVNLFVHDAARPTGWSRESVGGRPVLRFDWEIPQTLQPSTISNGAASASVGLKGSFWVDADSLDLLEVEDRAIDVPLELLMTDVENRTRYEREKIGELDVILPREAVMLVTHLRGEQSRNVSRFSACREFSSESKISFDK